MRNDKMRKQVGWSKCPLGSRANRALLAAIAAVALLPAAAPANPTVTLVPFASVNRPVDIANAGDGRLFVVDQDGEIVVLDSSGSSLGTFLDIQGRVLSPADGSGNTERGLLGLAFHPDYASNGFFFVNYTRDPGGATRISRFSRVGTFASNVADPDSELVILEITQPFANHNAGDLNFGPDGYLWIAMGDGGAGGDPGNRAQDPGQLLGKMLRIDVDSGSPYAIPADNPFVGGGLPLDEIWSLGFRNPFRFSFDRLTGDLWIADVGQNVWEEVNFEPASTAGGLNYGWRCYEGPASFNLSGCGPVGNYTFPVHSYNHSAGRCTVIGGFVYRGSQYASLIGGHYFFADFCTGELWSLSPGCAAGFDLNSFGKPFPVFGASTFGEGADGEIYAGSLNGNTVYRLQASGTPAVCPPACPPTPLAGCRQPGLNKASILIKNDTTYGKNKLLWKWVKGEETLKQDFGNPTPESYTFCVYAGPGQDVVLEGIIPSAASCPQCWKETGSGFKYKVAEGIEKLTLKSGAAGKPRIILKGTGSLLPTLPSIPVSQPVLVQLSNGSGECWEAAYSDPIKNEGVLYKDKSD